MALIEREAALEICEKEYQERLRMLDYCGDTVAWNIGNAIKALPTIDPVHAEGACYCRECEHANPREDTGADMFECPMNGVTVFCKGSHFCGYGVPREAQDDE